MLILLKSSQAGAERAAFLSHFPCDVNIKIEQDDLLESVDGQPGYGVVGGVVLGLADGLHPAGLVLDVHVVEGHVEEVNAGESTEIIIRARDIRHVDRAPNTSESSIKCVPIMQIMFVNSFPVVQGCILAPPQHWETCSLWLLLLLPLYYY